MVSSLHGPWRNGIRVIAVASLLAVLSADPLQAHEVWLLPPLQVAALASKPSSPLFTQVNALGLGLGLIMALGLMVVLMVDRLMAGVDRRLTEIWGRDGQALMVLVCRWGLGLLMLTAALGLAPRHGTAYLAEPTLFVGDLQLSDPGGLWLKAAVALQVTLGILLMGGVYPRLAALGVIGLVGLGYSLFGGDMNAYVGHILAPALVVFLLSERPQALFVQTRAHSAWLAMFDSIPPQTALRCFQVLVGVNFIYLAVLFKFQNPNLIIAILETWQVPVMGMPLDVVAYVMALVEMIVGLLIACGIAVRLSCLAVLGAMIFFIVTLGEPPHVHANIIGAVVALLIAGQEREPATNLLSLRLPLKFAPALPAQEIIRLTRKSAASPLSPLRNLRFDYVSQTLIGCIALAGLWTPLIADTSGPSSKLFASVLALEPPRVQIALNTLKNGHYEVHINASHFQFAALCTSKDADKPYRALTGHAHVYVDGVKVATAHAPVVDIGPLPSGARTLTVTLNDLQHRYYLVHGQLLTAERNLLTGQERLAGL